ncbi:hypothetical protein GPECTOR_3g185 [Gonium pectorale]|uniref:Uncharacterized protein n=1 Tax=Gonium pectorale TaxID=33097 RepID=A0A150GZ56_GONPE|nr:hypothetical protein GPECTOR_3g185 [Gonium pectorale]|eukprot:KXZ55023.1 hypothetical protein GPECTOR_3g185 [Gonium pectorale]
MGSAGSTASEGRDARIQAQASRNQVVPVAEAYDSRQLEADTARLRKQLEEVMANHARNLEATAVTERKRLDEAATAERRRQDEEAAARRRELDEVAAAERRRLDGEAEAARGRREEEAKAGLRRREEEAEAGLRRREEEAEAGLRRREEEAAAARKQADEDAEARRLRQDEEAVVARKRLDEEAAAERRLLDEAAAAERKRLDEVAAAERRHLGAAADIAGALFGPVGPDADAAVRPLASRESAGGALDEEAAVARRRQLDEEAAAQRRMLDEEAAATRRRLDEAAATERRRLDEEAAAERKRLAEAAKAALNALRQDAGSAASNRATPPAAVLAEGAAAAAVAAQEVAVLPQKLETAGDAAVVVVQAAPVVVPAAAAPAAPPAARGEPLPLPAGLKTGGEDLLARIPAGGTSLEQLPESIADLHDGMPAALRTAPMRLLRVEAVLAWPNIKVYEEVDVESEAVEMPYGSVTDDVWDSTIILSWRWNATKPAEYQPGFSPMSDLQYGELSAVLRRAHALGIQHVWIDWCCVPQYKSDPMVEVLRSKVYYARARAMAVVPTFHPIPADGIVRLLLVKASRVVRRHAGSSPVAVVVAGLLDSILSKEQVAGREYFSRVWTLAERMARFGRPEHLSNWLSLEAWLGMLVDALLKSTDDRKASAIYKRILGSKAGEMLDSILDPLQEADLVRVAGGTRKHLMGMATKLGLVKMVEADPSDRKLLDAAAADELAGVLEALGEGANPDAPEVDGKTALYYAAEKNNAEAARALLEAGASTQIKTSSAETPLFAAAANSSIEVARLLLAAGAEVDSVGKGHEEVTKLLMQSGANKEALNEGNHTPLAEAVAHGKDAVVRAMLDAGADKNYKWNNNWSLLHEAAQKGHEAVVKMLLSLGLNKDQQNNGGHTPLHIAARGNHAAVVNVLLEAGANTELLISENKNTALAEAALGNAPDAAKALLDAGAKKEVKNKNFRTPLMIAAAADNVAVLRVLAQGGCSLEAMDDTKWRALHLAANFNAYNAAKALIELGASKYAQTDKHSTPYAFAKTERMKALLPKPENASFFGLF